LNEDYLEANHGVNPDSVDIVFRDNVSIEGSTAYYDSLYNFVRFHPPSVQENYEEVERRMDIDEYMNYYIAEIYFFNQDWPFNNNKFWREQKEGSKWRWILYDLDFGFGATKRSDNMVEWATDPSIYQNYIFIRLLDNTGFRNEFLQRFRAHMNTSFQPDRVVQMIDAFQERLQPYMERHIERWGEPSSMEYWETKVEDMRRFASQRLPELKTNLNNKFGIGSEKVLSLLNADPGMSKVLICEVEIPDTFSGPFYSSIPLRIEAVPAKGCTFSGWTGDLMEVSGMLTIDLSAVSHLEAHFTPASPGEGLFINEVLCKNNGGLKDECQEYEDWIELYNAGSSPIDLAGLMISDDNNDLDKFRINSNAEQNSVLEPGGHRIFFADKDPEQGWSHLDFKLNADGESIYLSRLSGPDTLIIDSIYFAEQYADVSFGRMPDGSENLDFMKPTPDSSNRHFDPVAGIVINEFSADNKDILVDPQGNYTDWIELHNTLDVPFGLGGMFLTDSLGYPFKFRISDEFPDSTTIPPGGYLIFYADNGMTNSVTHTNFKLSAKREEIGLALPDGSNYIDALSYGKQFGNSTFSRYPNGSAGWAVIPPTPMDENIYNPIGGLVINEFSADNQSIVSDSYDSYPDWIEIYNTNNFAVDLGGFYLTDNLQSPNKHRIPTTERDSTRIEALGYMLFIADDSDEAGVRHTNFRLSRRVEQIGLTDHLGNFLDSISYPEQYENASSSRIPDAGAHWKVIPSTPGKPNEFVLLDKICINEISTSNTQYADEEGESDDWIELYNGHPFDVNIGGYYLTNDLLDRLKCRIPTKIPELTTIPARGFLLFWADNTSEQGVRHLDFKLSGNGEELGLINPDLTILDSLSFGEQYSNSCLARYPDGSATWITLPLTPENTNRLPDYSGLIINELASVNHGEIYDDFGEADDWIEIYNDNPYPLNIGGLFLSDDQNNFGKYRIPMDLPEITTLEPYEYFLFWADESVEQGATHLNFKLSQTGEWVGFYSEYALESEIVDSVTLGPLGKYQSFGRNPEKSMYPWQYF